MTVSLVLKQSWHSLVSWSRQRRFITRPTAARAGWVSPNPVGSADWLDVPGSGGSCGLLWHNALKWHSFLYCILQCYWKTNNDKQQIILVQVEILVLDMHNAWDVFFYLFIYLHGEFKASAWLLRLLLGWKKKHKNVWHIHTQQYLQNL